MNNSLTKSNNADLVVGDEPIFSSLTPSEPADFIPVHVGAIEVQ